MRWKALLSCSVALGVSFASCSAPGSCETGTMSSFDRTILVTGCNGRIGTEIVRQLFDIYSEKTNERTRLVCVARSEDKVKALVESISKGGEGAVTLQPAICDVSLQGDIVAFAQRWAKSDEQDVDVLVNNAAVTPTSREETKEGIELQFATNVLGYHWMMREFEPFLRKSAQSKGRPARVVNVASFYAGGLDVGDVEFKKRRYDVDSSYRASKEANRLQSAAMAEAWKDKGINVNSVHPGVATSNVSLGLGYDLDRSDEAARACAEGPVRLASDETLANVSGAYFSSTKKSACEFAKNQQKIRDLMRLLDNYHL